MEEAQQEAKSDQLGDSGVQIHGPVPVRGHD